MAHQAAKHLAHGHQLLGKSPILGIHFRCAQRASQAVSFASRFRRQRT
jgi:hypothetical protein